MNTDTASGHTNTTMPNPELKEDIVKIMSSSSYYSLYKFLKSVSESHKMSYPDELRYIESQIEALAKYQTTLLSRLQSSQVVLVPVKRSMAKLEKLLSSPKLQSSKCRRLAKEIEQKNARIMLLESELAKLKSMHDLIEQININNKEKISQIERNLERSALTG